MTKKSITSHFVIVGVSETTYPALPSPQAVLGFWGVVDGDRDVLHPFLVPSDWVGSVLNSQRSPVDRGGLLLLQGLQVVFRETSIDALRQFQSFPHFGRVFVKRHDGLFQNKTWKTQEGEDET